MNNQKPESHRGEMMQRVACICVQSECITIECVMHPLPQCYICLCLCTYMYLHDFPHLTSDLDCRRKQKCCCIVLCYLVKDCESKYYTSVYSAVTLVILTAMKYMCVPASQAEKR